MKYLKYLSLLISLVLLAAIVGCQGGEKEVTRVVPKEVEVTRLVQETVVEKETVVEEVEVTRVVEVPVQAEVTAAPESDVPFQELWASSPHANAESEAFRHWDEDDPQEVPPECAKCHSTFGFIDFVGADGTEFGVVDNPAPIGSTVECNACHNDQAVALTSVVMPSGTEITGLGREARCMQCHQGRESGVSVEARIEEAGVDADTVGEELGFANIHYYAAAATKYGTFAMGGYQYQSKTYDGNFAHVEAYDSCIECHDSHSLQVKVEECSVCHEGVSSVEDIRNVRMAGSLTDYDGDGDIEEGIYYEIEGIQAILMQAIQAYAAETAGTAIVYSPDAYPYFFIDTNGNGELEEDEAAFPNRYASWTPRLLRAAYNYQVSVKDPGQFAHGGKYIIQLLYDSVEDLNPDLVAGLNRIDAGHFAGSEEAFRHWDADGEVPGSCSKCHSADGLPEFLKEGVAVSQPLSNGLKCSTCHSDEETFTLHEVAQVTFPSGATIDTAAPTTNLCMNCHQGRESGASVNNLIARADVDDDATSEALRFLNVHYFAAGATRYGGEVQGAYQYEGKEYVGYFAHVPNFDGCINCHSAHNLVVNVQTCAGCHQGVETAEDLEAIRMTPTDFDGDGDAAEGIAGEIETLAEQLYTNLQAYAADTVGTAIVYTAAAHPYFFVDTNANGEADPDELNRDNQFNSWTPRLLKAAYNYQYATKDPGAFAHNAKYIIQVLYDAIEDVGGDVNAMTRP